MTFKIAVDGIRRPGFGKIQVTEGVKLFNEGGASDGLLET